VVISVRNCMVKLGIDTLYYAQFLTGGAFNPYVVPPYKNASVGIVGE